MRGHADHGERLQRSPVGPSATATPKDRALGAEALAAHAGNRAFMRAVVAGHPLLRQPGQAPPPQAPAPQGQGADAAQPQAQAQLSPEASKKLIYAQTVLAKVGQLPEADRASLKKMVEGSDVMALIERRDKLRTDLEQARSELETTKDISGPERADAEKRAQSKVDSLGLDLEGVETEIDQNLKKLGVASEADLVELVTTRFPEMWKERAKLIADKMLDENLAAVEKESRRYDYFAGGAPKDAYDDIGALRLADREIAATVVECARLDSTTVGSLEILREQVASGTPKSPPGASEEMDLSLAEARTKKGKLLTRWQELGVKHVILLHPSYKPGSLDASGDEDLLKVSGGWIEETRDNIKNTRENVKNENVSLWGLRDVPDLTFDSLGVPRDSVLGKAVAKHFEGKKEDEEAKRAAMDALAIGATIVGFLVGGPFGAMVAGAVVGGAVGIAELAEDYGKAQARFAAGGVALDPELAKMSTEEPDLFAVAMDVVALGFVVADAVKVVRSLSTAIRALAGSGAREEFVVQARKIIGDEAKAAALADKIAVRPRAMPPGGEQIFTDHLTAGRAYRAAYKADPTREVGLYHNRRTGEFKLVYGTEGKLPEVIVSKAEAWEIVKHHHPGKPVVAQFKDRIPSSADFHAVDAPARVGAHDADKPVKSIISWYDDEMKMRYTTFGKDPAEAEPYWVRYVDPLTDEVKTKRFALAPYEKDKGGETIYDLWARAVEDAEKTGAPTVRP